MSQTDPDYDVPCDQACDAYKELADAETERQQYEFTVAESVGGWFEVIATELPLNAVLNVGTIVFLSDDPDDCHEVAEMLRSGDALTVLGTLCARMVEEQYEEGEQDAKD